MSTIEALGGLSTLTDCELGLRFLQERYAELGKQATKRILAAVKPGDKVELKGKIAPFQTPVGVGFIWVGGDEDLTTATVYYVGTETVGAYNLKGHAVKVPAIAVSSINGTGVA